MKAGLFFQLEKNLYPIRQKLRIAKWRKANLIKVRYRTKLRMRLYRKRLEVKNGKTKGQ